MPAHAARLAIVAKDMADLQSQLEAAAKAIAAAPEKRQESPAGWYYGQGEEPGKIAFLFPGQGSQYPNMGADLAMAFDVARQIWDLSAELSLDETWKLHEVVFPLPVFNDAERDAQTQRLTATQWAQPAIGAASLACLRLLRRLGVEADCVGGHSFGEVTALCAAGAFDERSLLSIARRRGELMAEAASLPGSMTAVTHNAEELAALIAAWDSDVVLANRNSPRQVVLSGKTISIEEAEVKLKEKGIRFRRLPVATAFHSAVVSPAAEPFAAFLQRC